MVFEHEGAHRCPLSPENRSGCVGDIGCRDCGFSSCIMFAEPLTSGGAKVGQRIKDDPRMPGPWDALLAFDLTVVRYYVMMESLPHRLLLCSCTFGIFSSPCDVQLH